MPAPMRHSDRSRDFSASCLRTCLAGVECMVAAVIATDLVRHRGSVYPKGPRMDLAWSADARQVFHTSEETKERRVAKGESVIDDGTA